jgi:PAS domain S-box-containing protein
MHENSFFNVFAAAFPDGLLTYDSSLKCIFINKSACQILHLKETEILQKPIKKLFSGLENTFNYNKFCQALASGEEYSCSFSCREDHFSVKGFKAGEQLFLLITSVSEDKLSEKKRKTELDTLLSNISSQVFFKNKSFEYTSINEACVAFHDFPLNKIIGKTDYDIFSKEQADTIREEDKKVILNGETIKNTERSLFNNKGDMIWVSTTKTPLKDANGEIIGLLGISFDITAIKVAKAEIELLAAAIQQTPEMVIITDTEGKIQYINPAFEEITGYSPNEAIGKTPAILKSRQHTNTFYYDLWKTLKDGKAWRGHFSDRKKDESIFDCDAVISPVKSKEGTISNYISFMKDVTHEKQLESQLRQSQKMDAVGRLAGGIAHDFNNILTAILGYSELLIKTLDENDPAYHKVIEIRKAGKRASALTGHMLAFSKKQVISQNDMNINKIIADMVEMLQRIIGENIKLTFDFDISLDNVKSSAIHIEQIIMNLVVNAKDAIPSSGAIINISTKNTFLKTEFKNANFTAHPGSYVMISVQDNGCGIEKETAEFIFEPFYSKKKSSNGTGLGLSTIYGIVKQHDGYIQLESAKDQGSTFKIFLPASPGAHSSPEEETTEDKILNKGDIHETIIIVEDEVQVLDLTATILKLVGYKVITASSAEKALEYFHANNTIDLLLTDIVLGGMNGYDLSLAAKKMNPELRVLFMSGYPGETVKKLYINYSENNFILKPFSVDQLTKKIREQIKPESK